MSMTRTFGSLASFAHFFEERTAAVVPVGKLVIAESARMLYEKTRRTYGSHKLADLAQATQADRVAQGYTPNDPLLRDGSLLRDSLEFEVGEDFAAVGSSEPIAAYHEYGYINARTGTSVPARPVFMLALESVMPKVVEMIEANLGRTLGFGMLADAEPMLPGIGPEISGSTNVREG